MKRTVKAWAWCYGEAGVEETSVRNKREWVAQPFAGATGLIVPCTITFDDGKKPRKKGAKYGEVALILWPDGSVSVHRQDEKGSALTVQLSDELMDRIAALRGPMPGAALAAEEPDMIAYKFVKTSGWTKSDQNDKPTARPKKPRKKGAKR